MPTSALDFYYVDPAYVAYLQSAETAVHGSSHVPNVVYADRNKFMFGSVLQIDGINYFVPVSSKTNKSSDYNLQITVPTDHVKVKGTLRFPYMIPVPDAALTRLNIRSIASPGEQQLIAKERAFCLRNQTKILRFAERTHRHVVTRSNPALADNSCDFPLLENAYLKYCISHSISVPLEDRKRILQRNGLGSGHTLSDFFSKDEIQYRAITPDEAKLVAGQPDLLHVIRKGEKGLILQHLASDTSLVKRVLEPAQSSLALK